MSASGALGRSRSRASLLVCTGRRPVYSCSPVNVTPPALIRSPTAFTWSGDPDSGTMRPVGSFDSRVQLGTRSRQRAPPSPGFSGAARAPSRALGRRHRSGSEAPTRPVGSPSLSRSVRSGRGDRSTRPRAHRPSRPRSSRARARAPASNRARPRPARASTCGFIAPSAAPIGSTAADAIARSQSPAQASTVARFSGVTATPRASRSLEVQELDRTTSRRSSFVMPERRLLVHMPGVQEAYMDGVF